MEFLKIEQLFLYLDLANVELQKYKYYYKRSLTMKQIDVGGRSSAANFEQMMEVKQKKIFGYIDMIENMQLIYSFEQDRFVQGEKKMDWIPRKRYFKPTFRDNNNYDIMDDKWLVNIAEDKNLALNSYLDDLRDGSTKGGLNWYVQDQKSKLGDVENLFQYYPEIQFLERSNLDKIQRRWISKRPFMIHALRPVDKPHDGLYVPRMEPIIEEKKQFLDSQVIFGRSNVYQSVINSFVKK